MDESIDNISAYRWLMLAGISLIYFCFSLVHFSTAALVNPITSDVGLSLSQMGLVMGSWPFIYIIVALPAGFLLDRYGVQHMQTIGVITITCSAFLRAGAESYAELLMAFIIFGLGAPFVSVGMPKLVREWFPYKERGFALGICTAITAAGSMIALTLTNSVVMPLFSGNWRAAINLYGGVCTLIAIFWIYIVFHQSRHTHSPSTTTGSLKETSRECLELLRTPAIQTLLIMAIGVLFFMHSTINWLPKILMKTQPGMTDIAAGYWSSLPVVIGIISAVVIPKFATGKMEIIIMIGLFLAGVVASMLLANEVTVFLLIIALSLVGAVRGGLRPVVTMVLMHAPGVSMKNMGVATGLFFTIGQIGGVSGPAVFGYLADRTGGFTAPLYLLAGICIVLALLSSFFLYIKEDEQQKQVKEDPDSELARFSTDIET